MVAHFEAGELQPVRSGDHNDPLIRADEAPFHQLEEHRQGHTSMGAAVHPCAVGAGHGVGQLVLRDLLDEALKLLEDLHCPFVAHRIADLNSAGQSLPGFYRPVLLEACEEAQVEGIGFLALGAGNARQPVNESQLFHHQKAPAQGTDVAQVADGDYDPIGYLPIKLLHDLNAHRLLALHAQGIHRVGQVNGGILGDLFDYGHASVEVGVQGQHQRAIGDGLDELSGGDLASGQENDGGDSRRSSVGSQRCGGVASGGTGHSADGLAIRPHLLHHGDQHRHPQVFEGAGVAVTTQLHPQVLDSQLPAQPLGQEAVGIALVHGDHILILHLGADPLLLAPHARAVGPLVGADALVEELHPGGG